MSFRKIKLKIKKENLQEIVEALTKDNEVEVVLNVEENKKNFGYLSSTTGILDWDFMDSETNLAENKEEKPEIKIKKLEDIEIKDFNKLAWVVEFYWSLGKGGWQREDFFSYLDMTVENYIKNPNNITSGINHLMIKTLIEYYYHSCSLEEGVNDTLQKLKNYSQQIFQCLTISEVTKILYGKNKRA